MPNDFDDMVESDTKKIRRGVRKYRSDGSLVSSPAAILEGTLWSLAALSVIGMLAALPWVGQGKLIPGQAWIGIGCLSIVFFGGFAAAVRYVREEVNTDELDRAATPKIKR